MLSERFKTIAGMAQRFIACDREQSCLMPPDVREWLPEDHFAWFVLGAVESMDLEAFYGAYRASRRPARRRRTFRGRELTADGCSAIAWLRRRRTP